MAFWEELRLRGYVEGSDAATQPCRGHLRLEIGDQRGVMRRVGLERCAARIDGSREHGHG